MLFGCNQARYNDMAPNVSGITMVRVYAGDAHLKGVWPRTPVGTVGMFSLDPNYYDLAAGRLDTKVKALFAIAPAGTWVMSHHERNYSNMRPEGYTAEMMRAIDTRMLSLARQANPGLKYGVNLGEGSHLMQWTIPGLDFYSLDMYEGRAGTNTVRDVSANLNKSFNQLPGTGLRAIAETNSSTPSHRASWFREMYDYLYTHKGGALLTFWNPTGPYSGPWLNTNNPDPRLSAHAESTIYSLRKVAADAKRGSI